MNRFVAIAAALALAACANPQVQQAVVSGQQFCATATATGPLVVALVNTAGTPVTVTNKGAADVAAACALIGAIPVSPPANPAAAPVVAVKTG